VASRGGRPRDARSVLYVDSSALAKLVIAEAETQALKRHLTGCLVTSSELAIVEVTRACARVAPGAARQRARLALEDATLVGIDRPVVERAARLVSGGLRSLDAIHLATALAVEPDELVAYDRRLLEAAAEAGLSVASPGA